jgi:hypothetical protein
MQSSEIDGGEKCTQSANPESGSAARRMNASRAGQRRVRARARGLLGRAIQSVDALEPRQLLANVAAESRRPMPVEVDTLTAEGSFTQSVFNGTINGTYYNGIEAWSTNDASKITGRGNNNTGTLYAQDGLTVRFYGNEMDIVPNGPLTAVYRARERQLAPFQQINFSQPTSDRFRIGYKGLDTKYFDFNAPPKEIEADLNRLIDLYGDNKKVSVTRPSATQLNLMFSGQSYYSTQLVTIGWQNFGNGATATVSNGGPVPITAADLSAPLRISGYYTPLGVGGNRIYVDIPKADRTSFPIDNAPNFSISRFFFEDPAVVRNDGPAAFDTAEGTLTYQGLTIEKTEGDFIMSQPVPSANDGYRGVKWASSTNIPVSPNGRITWDAATEPAASFNSNGYNWKLAQPMDVNYDGVYWLPKANQQFNASASFPGGVFTQRFKEQTSSPTFRLDASLEQFSMGGQNTFVSAEIAGAKLSGSGITETFSGNRFDMTLNIVDMVGDTATTRRYFAQQVYFPINGNTEIFYRGPNFTIALGKGSRGGSEKETNAETFEANLNALLDEQRKRGVGGGILDGMKARVTLQRRTDKGIAFNISIYSETTGKYLLINEAKTTSNGATVTTTRSPAGVYTRPNSSIYLDDVTDLDAATPIRANIRTGTIRVEDGQYVSDQTNLVLGRLEVGLITGKDADLNDAFWTPELKWQSLAQPVSGDTFTGSLTSTRILGAANRELVPAGALYFWGEGKSPLNVTNVSVPGTMNLGTKQTPGAVITSGELHSLRFAVSKVTVRNQPFTPDAAAGGLYATLAPPAKGGQPLTYVIIGNATTNLSGVYFADSYNVRLGGASSIGLALTPTTNSYTFDFNIVSGKFTLPGAELETDDYHLMKLSWDPTQGAYVLGGGVQMTTFGFKQRMTLTPPTESVNMPTGTLSSTDLNFYPADYAMMLLPPNGLEGNRIRFWPRSVPNNTNPLRAELRGGSLAVAGTVTVDLSIGTFAGTVPTTSGTATSWTIDTSEFANQQDQFSYLGINFWGLTSLQFDTTRLSFRLPHARYNDDYFLRNVGGDSYGAFFNMVRMSKTLIANIKAGGPGKVGNYEFTDKFTANLQNIGNPTEKWTFDGPSSYFGSPITVSATGPNKVEVGGVPGKGTQLNQTVPEVPAGGDSLPIPTFLKIAGYGIDLRSFNTDSSETTGGTRTVKLSKNGIQMSVASATFTLNVSTTLKITSTGVSIEAFTGSVNGNTEFTIGGAKFRIENVTVAYQKDADPTKATLGFGGRASMSFRAGTSNVDVTIDFRDDKGGPGLVVRNGSIDSVDFRAAAEFGLMKISIGADVQFSYAAATNEYLIYGSAQLKTALQPSTAGNEQTKRVLDAKVTLGTKATPGIRIVDGKLKSLDFTIDATLNLNGVIAKTLDKNPLRLRYDRNNADDAILRITGGLSVTLRKGMTFAASLPGGGLVVNPQTGEIRIEGLRLEASDMTFGKLEIKSVFLEYRKSSGKLSISAGGLVKLPSGFEVGGSFGIKDGQLESIGIKFAKNPGLQVAGGLLNIYSIEGTVSGLDDIAKNFALTATVKATAGPKIDFGGRSFALAELSGTLTVTTGYLQIKGNAKLIGGLFGNAYMDGKLDWSAKTPNFSFTATLRLWPGDIIRGDIDAYIDVKGNIEFHADLGVFTPSQLPRIGGRSIGRFRVDLYVRPERPQRESYAKISVQFLIVSGSMTARFDRTVDWEIHVDFKLFSIDRSGTFSLRDAANRPTVTIDGASAVAGSPDAKIRWHGTTPSAPGTIVEFYADDDDQDMNGALIGVADYASGQQTFTWDDMVSMFDEGQPVHVYAVIRDADDAVGYSDYAAPFTATPGFEPTIVAPAELNFEIGRVARLSSAANAAIRVTDPRSSTDPDAAVQVKLSAGLGKLQLVNAPDLDRVVVEGDGTETLVISGRAAEVNALIDGLLYFPAADSTQADSLVAEVIQLPFAGSDGATTTIALQPKLFTVDPTLGGDPSAADAPARVPTGTADVVPLAGLILDDAITGTISAATIHIDGFTPGAELLSVPLAVQISNGIDTAYNPATGTLTLTGYQPVERYERVLNALEYRVKRTSGALPTGRSLTVTLSDDNGERGRATLPLDIRRGHVAPTFSANADPVFIHPDQDAVNIAPLATLSLDGSAKVSVVEFAFDPDSYRDGEDVLGYDANGNGIVGAWDAASGTLTLTGDASTAAWQAAIRTVYYNNVGATFHGDRRDVAITVYDNGTENNFAIDGVVITGQSTRSGGGSPTLTLAGGGALTLAGDQDFAYLDSALTLADPTGTLQSATVKITSGYVYGEHELAAYELFNGMSASFDPDTATLTIEGAGTVAEYQAALRGVVLLNTAGARTAGTVEIAMSVDNGVAATEASADFDAVVVDAPYLVDDLSAPAVYETGQSTVTVDTGVVIDHTGTLTGATVSIVGGFVMGQDFLSLPARPNITASYDMFEGVLTLTGTASVAEYQAALDAVQYRNALVNGRPGDRILGIRVQSGTLQSNEALATLVVSPARVGPTITVGAPLAPYIENGPAVRVVSNLTLADPDGANADPLATDGDLYGASIVIANYYANQDVLSFTDTPDIFGTWDADSGTLLLNGRASVAAYQAALRSITYRNTSDMPGTAPREIEIQLLDGDDADLGTPAVARQIVRAISEAPVLIAGTLSPLSVLRNAETTSLGLEDLVYAPKAGVASATSENLYFVVTALPDETLGQVCFEDGAPVALNGIYPIGALAGLTFTATPAAAGSGQFAYAVQMRDLDADTADAGRLNQSVAITVQPGVTTTTGTQAYVAQVYRDLLGRDPTNAELTSAATLIDAAIRRARDSEFVNADEGIRGDFTRGIVASTEFRENQVRTSFAILLGRDPTNAELAARVTALANGASLTSIRDGLLATPEFYTRAGGTDDDFVNAVADAIFGTDEGEVQRVLQRQALADGASRQDVITAMSSDADATNHTFNVAVNDLLRRDASDDDASAYSPTVVNDLVVRALIAASDEYYARYATPGDGSGRIANQATTGYAAVGKVGDANGDKATGTLIAPQYALVAAHSVANVPTAQVTFTVGGVTYDVDEVFIHPAYLSELSGQDGASDIAILKLASAVTNVAPAKLIDAAPSVGEFLNLVGFGTKFGSEYGIKRVGSTPNVDQLNPTTFRWTYRHAYETNSTQGDSGAPLFLTYGGAEYVAGIVSGGRNESASFGDVAVNTRVDAFLPWIESIVGAITVPNPAPTVVDAEYAFDAPTQSVTVTFSDDVFDSLSTADIVVKNIATNAIVTGVSLADYDFDSNSAEFAFTSTLPAGNYRLTLASAGVTDGDGIALDGDADGTAGGDYTFDFFELKGDANRDRRTNFDDLLTLAANYNQRGTTWADGDFNGDARVNFDDLLLLAANYNVTLAPPASAPLLGRSSPAPVSQPLLSAGPSGSPFAGVAPIAPPRDRPSPAYSLSEGDELLS